MVKKDIPVSHLMMGYKLFEDFFTLTEDLNCDINCSDRCDGVVTDSHIFTRGQFGFGTVLPGSVCSGFPNNFYLFLFVLGNKTIIKPFLWPCPSKHFFNIHVASLRTFRMLYLGNRYHLAPCNPRPSKTSVIITRRTNLHCVGPKFGDSCFDGLSFVVR